MVGALAQANESTLLERWATLKDLDPADRSVAASQERRLRGCVLGLLARCGEHRHSEIIRAAYDAAGCMSDRMAALGAAVEIGGSLADACLAEFHARFAGDPGVIDKWFAAAGDSSSRHGRTRERLT